MLYGQKRIKKLSPRTYNVTDRITIFEGSVNNFSRLSPYLGQSEDVVERHDASFVDKKSTVMWTLHNIPKIQFFGFRVDFWSTYDAAGYCQFVDFLSTIHRQGLRKSFEITWPLKILLSCDTAMVYMYNRNVLE